MPCIKGSAYLKNEYKWFLIRFYLIHKPTNLMFCAFIHPDIERQQNRYPYGLLTSDNSKRRVSFANNWTVCKSVSCIEKSEFSRNGFFCWVRTNQVLPCEISETLKKGLTFFDMTYIHKMTLNISNFTLTYHHRVSNYLGAIKLSMRLRRVRLSFKINW